MKSAFNRSILALAAIAFVAGASQASAQQKALKKYESGTKEFWTNPPPDWFLGDETEAQKGQAPPSGPPTGASDAELAAMMKKIKLPAGFKIEVYASGVLAARQMAWGDKGTLFVGSFGLGNVYAIKDNGGKKEVKTVLKGLQDADRHRVSRRRALRRRYRQADQDTTTPKPISTISAPARWSMTTCRPMSRMAGNTSRSTRRAGSICRSDRPSTSACRRPACRRSAASIPRPATPNWWRSASATASAATSIRARGRYWFTENARDWISDDMPERQAQHDLEDRRAFRLSLLPPGRHAGSEIRDGSQVLGVHAAGASISARMWRRSA